MLRAGQVLDLNMGTIVRDGRRKDRVLGWAGAVYTAVPLEVKKQQQVDGAGVYVAARMPGSPAAWYNLQPTNRIIEVPHKSYTCISA